MYYVEGEGRSGSENRGRIKVEEEQERSPSAPHPPSGYWTGISRGGSQTEDSTTTTRGDQEYQHEWSVLRGWLVGRRKRPEAFIAYFIK